MTIQYMRMMMSIYEIERYINIYPSTKDYFLDVIRNCKKTILTGDDFLKIYDISSIQEIIDKENLYEITVAGELIIRLISAIRSYSDGDISSLELTVSLHLV